MDTSITFLGTGLMGNPMAANLIQAGFNVTIWNRTYKKILPLISIGGTPAKSLENAVAKADIIITMLENGDVVREVIFDQNILSKISPNSTLIDMSSIPPETAREHAAWLMKRDIQCIDAPVSGGTTGAADGTLAIMAGGKESVFNKISKIFLPLGKATYVGPSGAGQLTKLANQVICGGYLTAVAEGLTLAIAGGANPIKVREALMGGFADSKVLRIHGDRMVNKNFTPGGKCRIFLKDLNTVLSCANSLELDLPTAKVVQRIYSEVCELGFGEEDQAASILAIEERNKKLTTN